MCGDKYFRHDNHWVFVNCEGADNINKRRFAKSLGLATKTYNKLKGFFFIDFKKPSNYETLSTQQKIDLEEQIDNMIDSKYSWLQIDKLFYIPKISFGIPRYQNVRSV